MSATSLSPDRSRIGSAGLAITLLDGDTSPTRHIPGPGPGPGAGAGAGAGSRATT
jgi:hypothetical protein